MLTSRLKTGELIGLDGDKIQNLFAEYGIIPTPGLRECFFLKISGGDWLMCARIPEDFDNKTPYTEQTFAGSLFAVASSFMESMDDTFVLLRRWIADSGDYQLDMNDKAALRCNEMIEEIMPWDLANMFGRYQQDVFIPIRMKGAV
jgi:hypothetical protein